MAQPSMTRPYLITLCVLWSAGSIAGIVFAQDKGIPIALALGVLPAFLIELTFYLSMATERECDWWDPRRIVLLAPLPYLMAAVASGTFSAFSLVTIPAAVAVVCVWPRVFGGGFAARFGFLALVAAPELFKLAELLYARPHEDLPLSMLGRLLWIRAGLLTALGAGYASGVRFGFVPCREEWRVGALGFLAGLIPLSLIATQTGFVAFTGPRVEAGRLLLTSAGNFLGIYLVVALSEEMFFRAMLQQWVPRGGIILASLVFGAAHLGYREFPNYAFAATAAAAGLLYGLVYNRGGLRAAMVCHGLTVTFWRAFFR
jgi:membrane protease YdiL (CAAX protease family)